MSSGKTTINVSPDTKKFFDSVCGVPKVTQDDMLRNLLTEVTELRAENERLKSELKGGVKT